MSNEKLDYVIKTLKLVKDEVQYANSYIALIENDETSDDMLKVRRPNGTLIREGLRTAGRLCYILANETVLSPYTPDMVFKDDIFNINSLTGSDKI